MVRFVVSALSLLFLILLVVLEYFLFEQFFDYTYFQFWIERGPLIAFSATLIGLVWSDLDKQHPDLISAHPGYFLRTCFIIMSGVFLAFANTFPQKRSGEKIDTEEVSSFRLLYDNVVTLIIYLILSIVAAVWMICFAPTLYFVNLITGAPARLSLLSKADQIQLVRSSNEPDGTTVDESFILSFAKNPVTVTQALTAGLLTLIRLSGLA